MVSPLIDRKFQLPHCSEVEVVYCQSICEVVPADSYRDMDSENGKRCPEVAHEPLRAPNDRE